MTIVLLIVSIVLLLLGLTMTIIGLCLGFFTDTGFAWYDWLLLGIGVGFMVLAIILMITHYAMKCTKKTGAAPVPPPVPPRDVSVTAPVVVEPEVQQPIVRPPSTSVPVNRWDPRTAYTGSDVLGQLQGTGY